MRLIFAGTGGYHPNERRQTACVFLPEIGLALDAGTSFFRIPSLLQTTTLDVLLTHAHLDHIVGLTYPIVALLRGEIETLRVHGTQSTLDAVRSHLFSPALFPVEPRMEWCPLEGELSTGQGGRIRWKELVHPGGSVGFRIDWPGKSMAYITDTTAPGDYADFIRGVDLLIHECYFPDGMDEWAEKTGHSAATPVAQLAAASGIGQLYLVHVDPQRPDDDPIGLEQIRRIFPASWVPEDMQEIEF